MTDQDRLVDEETSDTFAIDLEDDTSAEDRDAAIRDAVRAVEESRSDDTSSAVAPKEGAACEGEEAQELQELREEVETLRERSVRTMADFENYRKRIERERAETRRLAVSEPLGAFLDVVDNLERALASDASGEDLRVGVEMIHRQMNDILKRFGVEEVSAENEPFDPAVHEAVARREGEDVESPLVVQELQRGYRIEDRLLRPSRVVVAVPAEAPEEQQPANGEEFPGAESDDAERESHE